MMINLDLLAYDQPSSLRFFPELQRRVEALPGVRAAALASEMPLMDSRQSRGPVVKEGEIDPPPNQGVNSECSLVTPKYFDTLRMPLVRGRDFTDRDNADAPRVVIVNQAFARRFYGGEEEALGKRFRFAQGTPLMEIVGIAQDGYYSTLYEEHQTYMFLPVYQHPRARMTLLVGTQSAGALETVVESARREIAQMDARLPVFGVMMAEQNLSLAYWGARVAAGMASTFGVLALVLATMGLYSVMTYTVSQRTHEIGIRMALGAALRDVVRLVIGQGMRMALIGVALGLAVALLLTRALASLLLGIGTTDLVTFVGVPLLLVAVALLACYIPARRAARVNPLVALRHD
jgi:predicted permease